MNFADRLKQLPSASHLAALHLLGPDGQVLATIENKPGQTGSLVVYAALAALYGGRITPATPQTPPTAGRCQFRSRGPLHPRSSWG